MIMNLHLRFLKYLLFTVRILFLGSQRDGVPLLRNKMFLPYVWKQEAGNVTSSL